MSIAADVSGSGEKPLGFLVTFVAECEKDSTQTLQAVREVWGDVLNQADPSGLTLDEWRKILPRWFVEKCGPEISLEEAERRRTLPMEERMRFAETWSLGAWKHWLKPSERQWVWWNAEIDSPRLLRLKVVVSGFPFPAGSLQWLLKCCGAKSVEILERQTA